jgi:NTE family protein
MTAVVGAGGDEDARWSEGGVAAVVIAGAGARGAYEAGVLAELLPSLFPEGLANTVLLGTSAGAVNAALWAQGASAGRALAAVGDEACQFWLDLDVAHVYRPLVVSVAKRLPVVRWLGHFEALLDTAPLFATARAALKRPQLERNLAEGSVRGLGIVATSCPLDGTGGRSAVFFEGRGLVKPATDPGSAIDFVPAQIDVEHVLASAAIPLAFPAVRIDEPASERGYYCDGGVRLNAPVQPAIKFGAERLVVVSSHATTYPAKGPLVDEMPDVIDVTAQALHAVLADGMIEDLRALKRINKLVRQARAAGLMLMNDESAPPRPYRDLPLVEVSPPPGKLAEEASNVLRESPAGSLSHLYRRLEYGFLRAVVAGLGGGAGNDELLSYLLFDRTYAAKQIELGRADGRAMLVRLGRA